MTIPHALQDGIDDLTGAFGPAELERSARALSDAYRAGGSSAARAARTAGEVAAYLATRAPATYAAVEEVCHQTRLARPGWAPGSVLDLGAGPGIAAWAVVAEWPEVTSVAFVEAEPEMLRAGKALAERGRDVLREARWLSGDAGSPAEAADLVIASYLIGELEPRALAGFVDHVWSLTTDTLVVVEPGTTAGYRRILAAREGVIAAGGSTLAPCPHDEICPLPEGDWCHFAARLGRSRTHRLAKGADRGFEDEKFSYAVLCRSPQQTRPVARVIRRPDPRPGHVVLDLCTADGLERRTVSKRDGTDYRRARKLGWGDAL
jgi:ribosomal protein RSM22 (predicted rRNA methylase)